MHTAFRVFLLEVHNESDELFQSNQDVHRLQYRKEQIFLVCLQRACMQYELLQDSGQPMGRPIPDSCCKHIFSIVWRWNRWKSSFRVGRGCFWWWSFGFYHRHHFETRLQERESLQMFLRCCFAWDGAKWFSGVYLLLDKLRIMNYVHTMNGATTVVWGLPIPPSLVIEVLRRKKNLRWLYFSSGSRVSSTSTECSCGANRIWRDQMQGSDIQPPPSRHCKVFLPLIPLPLIYIRDHFVDEFLRGVRSQQSTDSYEKPANV